LPHKAVEYGQDINKCWTVSILPQPAMQLLLPWGITPRANRLSFVGNLFRRRRHANTDTFKGTCRCQIKSDTASVIYIYNIIYTRLWYTFQVIFEDVYAILLCTFKTIIFKIYYTSNLIFIYNLVFIILFDYHHIIIYIITLQQHD